MPDAIAEEGASLTIAELAFEADVPIDFLRRLQSEGLLPDDGAGRFPARWVRRVRLFHGIMEAGIGLERVRFLLDQRFANLDIGDRMFPSPVRRSKRRVSEYLASLGDRADLFVRVWATLGLPELNLERSLSVEDEAVLASFLRVWGSDPAMATRGARVMADAVRHLVDGYGQLVVEHFLMPYIQAARVEETPAEIVDVVPDIVPGLFQMVQWLAEKYIERSNIAVNVDNAEAALTHDGLPFGTAQARRAIVFADLSGYTAQTHQMGDERAADLALQLHDHADETARSESGRLLKLLGDGAMLIFRNPESAIRATKKLIAAWPTDLPPLHVGIGFGPVLEFDGDAYGSTVNLAARLSQLAGPHQVLAGSILPDSALHGPDRVPAGSRQLKGIPVPIEIVEVVVPALS
jgi:class 3 adenylate cyclase